MFGVWCINADMDPYVFRSRRVSKRLKDILRWITICTLQQTPDTPAQRRKMKNAELHLKDALDGSIKLCIPIHGKDALQSEEVWIDCVVEIQKGKFRGGAIVSMCKAELDVFRVTLLSAAKIPPGRVSFSATEGGLDIAIASSARGVAELRCTLRTQDHNAALMVVMEVVLSEISEFAQAIGDAIG